MTDPIRQTIQAGHMVLWEEIARDGAQAKTLLNASQRIKIARATAALFGEHGANHVIFAAGYPAICREEFEIISQMAAEVDNCSLATHGRAKKSDIDLGIMAIKRASYGRVSFALPVSEKHCQIMLHQSASKTIQYAIDLARYALDNAAGIPIDVALAVASREDPVFLAEVAIALAEEGVATIKICDSIGELFPLQTSRLFKQILERVPPYVAIGTHFHNDFGLALANNLETIRLGVRLVASSWLGLGERNGLAATEQLLMALSQAPERRLKRLGVNKPLWLSAPALKQLRPIAQRVSQMLALPLKVTDPIVSPEMNKIATGAYFNDPSAFRPFDPTATLGVQPQFILSHLANQGIVRMIAADLGYTLNREQAQTAFQWVKRQAYQRNRSKIPHAEFADYLAKRTNHEQWLPNSAHGDG